MTKKLFLSVQTVEDGGLLIGDRVYPEKQYVFTNPRGFYDWLCQQMGTNAKPDSLTHDGRVVVDANKLERLERIEQAVLDADASGFSADSLTALRGVVVS